MTQSKQVRRLLRGLAKLARPKRCYINARCDENAEWRSVLDANQRDGKIGIILTGMDCDCTSYYSARVEDGFTSVAAFKQHWERHCESLDGPETQDFCPPDQIEPEYRSVDLAMEAYEDGHPSTIYYRSA